MAEAKNTYYLSITPRPEEAERRKFLMNKINSAEFIQAIEAKTFKISDEEAK